MLSYIKTEHCNYKNMTQLDNFGRAIFKVSFCIGSKSSPIKAQGNLPLDNRNPLKFSTDNTEVMLENKTQKGQQQARVQFGKIELKIR